MPHIVQTTSIPATPWRNGGGVTHELLAWPLTSGDTGNTWQVRISVATIAQDGPFSAYPGVQRWFAVLEGSGVQLRFGPAEQSLVPGDAPLAFSGKDAPNCSLLGGPTRDLNLMSRGGTSSMQLIANSAPLVAHNGLYGGLYGGPNSLNALYTITPGIWCDNQGRSLALAAHTLLWEDQPPPGAGWSFSAADAAAPVHGYWLQYQGDPPGLVS